MLHSFNLAIFLYVSTAIAQQSVLGLCNGATTCVCGASCSSIASTISLCVLIDTASEQTSYGQCGGMTYTGPAICPCNNYCSSVNPYYSQCVPNTQAATTTSTARTPTTLITTTPSTLKKSFIPSSTTSKSPAVTTSSSTIRSPSVTSSSTTSKSKTKSKSKKTSNSKTTSLKTSSTKSKTASSSSTKTSSTASASTITSSSSTTSSTFSTSSTTSSFIPTATAAQYVGSNIAGFEFCGGDCTQGYISASAAYPPLTQYNGPDGAGQISHFVADDNMNIFRLPVSWQYLANDIYGGLPDSTQLTKYNALVQACLATGATCLIDIHNYARWNGGIIGQSGGPTSAQFAAFWGALAAKYNNTANVAFGIMNEPHDLTLSTWASTVQAAVTAIRQAGATTQIITLPGTDYQSAGSFVSDGSLDALKTISNLDGTTTNLVFDLHKYLDSDGSGTSSTCTTNNAAIFSGLATMLRNIRRQAIVSETGAGNNANCVTLFNQELAVLNQNPDVYLGYIGWAAGSFDSNYTLSETPTHSGNTWIDTLIVSSCLKR
ncbi:MAG: hypothetical protein M1834_005943 [Cirrosporium novae-zelandiae]|nr:MAG: hypothetical protein M1834_005943 [Cirrosporium novae-zelandiae]